MISLKIVKGRSRLGVPCKEASIEEGIDIIDKLSLVLEGETGIGLAANQIGIRKRVCIIRVPDDSNKDHILGYNFINPVITKREGPLLFLDEGCLSFPGLRVDTLRYNNISVKCSLHNSEREFCGLAAVAIQHEIDHLEGKTMFDTMFSKIQLSSTCPCGSKQLFKYCCNVELKKKQN